MANKGRNRAGRKNKRLNRHKNSMLAVSAVLLLLVAVVSIDGMRFSAKEKEYRAQEIELEKRIEEEKARSAEIDQLQDYVGTDEYIEEVAKDKLGLVNPNEIIFKAK